MDIEAILVIGTFCLGAGFILAVPGLWWARRKAKQLPATAVGAKRMSLSGIVYAAIFVVLIMCAFSLQYIAPQLSSMQRATAILIVFIVGLLGEKLANMFGIKLTKEKIAPAFKTAEVYSASSPKNPPD
ncbi:MAG: hypothetical protein JXA04_11475 [Gammaproteobacteria bacterium]|nr:hypothetical protein [Gammaproteobacteria bacterium]